MLLSLSEILEKVDKEPNWHNKINLLRQNQSASMSAVLCGAYDPRVKWVLPPGRPPFRKLPDTGAEGSLYGQTRTLYLYVENGGAPAGLTQGKKEELFTRLLEAIDPKDAELLIAMKDKRLPYPTITAGLVAAAFPGMLAGVVPEAPPQNPIAASFSGSQQVSAPVAQEAPVLPADIYVPDKMPAGLGSTKKGQEKATKPKSKSKSKSKGGQNKSAVAKPKILQPPAPPTEEEENWDLPEDQPVASWNDSLPYDSAEEIPGAGAVAPSHPRWKMP